MAALYDSIAEFLTCHRRKSECAEWMAKCFITNNVADTDKKIAIFLSNCGPPTYKLLKGLVALQKPVAKMFLELVTVLGEHFNPVPSVTVSRNKLKSRVRQKSKIVAVFVVELRQSSAGCSFATNLDVML